MRSILDRRFVCTIASIITALLLAEIILRTLDSRYERRRAEWGNEFGKVSTVHAHYPTQLTSTRGQTLGLAGYVRFQLNPFMVYGNLPNQRESHFTTNSRGFRGSEILPSGEKYRVFVTGGSTAFGTGLASDKDTLSYQLEGLLPEAEVINAAIIGHSSGQELSLAIHQLIDLAPNLIVSLSGWNDSYYGFNSPNATFMGFNNLEQVEERLRAYHLLMEQPILFRLGSQVKSLVFPALTRRVNRLSRQLMSPSSPSVDVRRSATTYANNMYKLMRLSELAGADFLCVLQPDIRSMRTSTLSRTPYSVYYQAFLREAAALLGNLGIRFIDLNQVASLNDPQLYLDAIHLNARGYHVMATELSGALEQLRLSTKFVEDSQQIIVNAPTG